MNRGERYLIPVLATAFRALEEIASAGRLSLTEVIARTGASKATAYRILTTLCHLGYLSRDDDKRYFTSPRIGALSSALSEAEGLKRVCLPFMIQLRNDVGETVNLGRLDHGRVCYLEVVPREYALRLHETPGATIPLHASALGKAILAFLPQETAESLLRQSHEASAETASLEPARVVAGLKRVRRLGFARDRGEVSSLATCIAAPIVDRTGRAIAAISVSGPTSRFNPSDQSSAVAQLIRAAEEIGRKLHDEGA